MARELGLDMVRFRADLDTHAHRAQIQADEDDAKKLGLTGTPAFFIMLNTKRFSRGSSRKALISRLLLISSPSPRRATTRLKVPQSIPSGMLLSLLSVSFGSSSAHLKPRFFAMFFASTGGADPIPMCLGKYSFSIFFDHCDNRSTSYISPSGAV